MEYDVGFDDQGRISALSVRGWWLAGADLDLAWNDMMIIQTGADQVRWRCENDLDKHHKRNKKSPLDFIHKQAVQAKSCHVNGINFPNVSML